MVYVQTKYYKTPLVLQRLDFHKQDRKGIANIEMIEYFKS